jgi:hypothetical protein
MSNAVRNKSDPTPDNLTLLTSYLVQNIDGDSRAAFDNIENIQPQTGLSASHKTIQDLRQQLEP